MRLVLVRHGQTLFNQLEFVQGWCDSPLTELGIQQAQSACEAIKDLRIDAAYSSTSERAYDTGCIVIGSRNIKVVMDKRLKEVNFGKLEGNFNYALSSMNDIFMKDGTYDYHLVDGESEKDMIDRYLDFLREIEKKHQNQTVLIAAHGMSIGSFVKELTKGKEVWLKNGQVVILEGNDLNYKLVELRNPSN